MREAIRRETLTLASVPALPVHEAGAVRAGDLLFLSGRMAAGPDGRLAEAARVPAGLPYFGSPIKRQTQAVLDDLERVCRESGASLERIVKAQVFLTHLEDFVYFDEVWRERFDVPPPRTTLAMPALVVDGARVLVDAVAIVDGAERAVGVSSDGPRPAAHEREAVRVGSLVFAGGQLATDFTTGVPPEARSPAPPYARPIKTQARWVLRNLARTFEAAGSSLDHVVKAQVFMQDLDDFPAFDEVWKEFFPTPPPRTTVGVRGLLVPGTLVEIDLVGVVTDGPWRPEIVPVPSGVPAPMANYSVAATAGAWVFAAGQIASDYRTGVPAEATVPEAFPYYGIAIKRQTAYILGNLARTLGAAGTSLDRVVKAQVFMRDLADFPAFEEVWRTFFSAPVPRTVVATTNLLVPGTLIEIDLTAVRSSATVVDR